MEDTAVFMEESVSDAINKARLLLWDVIEELDPESFSFEEVRDIFVSQASGWGKKTSRRGPFYEESDLDPLLEEELIEPDDESEENRFRVTIKGRAYYDQMVREIEDGV